jgi:hypothetical protein
MPGFCGEETDSASPISTARLCPQQRERRRSHGMMVMSTKHCGASLYCIAGVTVIPGALWVSDCSSDHKCRDMMSAELTDDVSLAMLGCADYCIVHGSWLAVASADRRIASRHQATRGISAAHQKSRLP